MWGVVSERAKHGPEAVGHCSLTTFEVQPPVRGEWYAGTKAVKQA